MTEEEQNELDLSRMLEKRRQAFSHLEEFKEWHGMDKTRSGTQILLLGLYRDIMRGTEEEVDYLIESLQEQNNTALMEKLQSGIA